MGPNLTMTVLDQIIEQYSEEEFLKADGFDSAVIGVSEPNMQLIYSVSKCLEVLTQEMDHEDAVEYFEFNVSGAYMGDKTPIWCYDNFVQ